jgi:hypothetical protein
MESLLHGKLSLSLLALPLSTSTASLFSLAHERDCIVSGNQKDLKDSEKC